MPLEEESLSDAFKSILNGKRPSLSSFEQLQHLNGGKHYYRVLSTSNFNEKYATISTSLGFSLRILRTQPVLAFMDGELKLNIESGLKMSVKSLVNVHSSLAAVEIRKMEARIESFVSVGVESMRSIEAHLPIQAEIQHNTKQGLKLIVKTPKIQKTRFFGIHTLTTTYTREFDPKTHLFREPTLKTVHAPHLEPHHVK